MNKLLNEINTYQNSDIDYDLFDKLQGEIELGAKVEIFWEDREETDKGNETLRRTTKQIKQRNR